MSKSLGVSSTATTAPLAPVDGAVEDPGAFKQASPLTLVLCVCGICASQVSPPPPAAEQQVQRRVQDDTFAIRIDP